MSLRFERKPSNRLRSTFSCKSRNDRDGGSGSFAEDPGKTSWAFRQAKFSVDYLNLMDKMPTIAREHKGGGSSIGRALPVPAKAPKVPDVLLHISEESSYAAAPKLGEERFVSFNCNKSNYSNNAPVAVAGKRRDSVTSTCTSTTSSFYAESSIGSTNNSNVYEDLIELGLSLDFKDLDMVDPRPVDPYRFSQATLEDTQEDELNAILGELSALQMSLDREIKQPGALEVPVSNHKNGGGGSGTGSGPTTNGTSNGESGVRTDSPDNDSGFSDNASLLSSGSSLSATGSSSGSSSSSCAIKNQNSTNILHASEDEKAEKIRVALAKMRAASITRLYVKAFSLDGSSKALMVDESMTCGRVLSLLADKNHVPLSSKWALVEHIPHLHMGAFNNNHRYNPLTLPVTERVYEDHENMVENLLMWTRDSKNKIFFVEREDKYDMFLNPQRYFLGEKKNLPSQSDCMDEHTKSSLIEEFFNHGLGVPEVESLLYLKAEGKKAWKKFQFVLRASGIYYYPKGKSSGGISSKDLVCLAPIDHHQQVYQGIGWRKKFKAPTEHGFVIKPPRLQVKSHRHMKYLCAEDPETLRLWMVGMRIAKFGKQMWENYRTLMEDLAHEDLDRFGRSVSLACMPQSTPTSTTTGATMEQRLDAVDPMMPPPPPLSREEGFESDAPVGGTIKRKPSTGLLPKIPLTLNTRSIVGDFINVGPSNADGHHASMTLQRKRSLSGNSSASSASSSASSHGNTVVVPIGLSTTPQPRAHSGSLLRNNKPAPLLEEAAEVIDYDSLPPPPPELLGDSPKLTRTLPPIPPAKPVDTSIYSTAGPSTAAAAAAAAAAATASTSSASPPPPKKGVSFANELSERLKSRAPEPIYGRTKALNGTDCPKKTVSFLDMECSSSSNPSSLLPHKLEEPPQAFLTDLQRVMEKKWQVAQKCNADRNITPHAILAFKFTPEGGGPTNPHLEGGGSHVQAWVSQHYGNAGMGGLSGGGGPPPSSSPKPPPPQRSSTITYPSHPEAHPQHHHQPMQQQQQQTNGLIIYENFQGRKSSNPLLVSSQYDPVHLRNKKPPPPVPKRADSTHLSAQFVYN